MKICPINPQNPESQILFGEDELARVTGVDAFTLNHMLPDHCGVPGHWRLVQGRTIYTERGAEELIKALEAAGKPAEAHSLRVALQARHDTPNRTPWYQREGVMA